MGHWSKSHSQPNVRQAVYMKKIILDLVDFPQHSGGWISKDWYDRRYRNFINIINENSNSTNIIVFNNSDIYKHGTVKELYHHATNAGLKWFEIHKRDVQASLALMSNVKPSNTRIVCAGTNTKGCVYQRARQWAKMKFNVEINCKICHDYFTTGENEYEKQIDAVLQLHNLIKQHNLQSYIDVTNNIKLVDNT